MQLRNNEGAKVPLKGNINAQFKNRLFTSSWQKLEISKIKANLLQVH